VPEVGFESTIPVFQRAKAVATIIGNIFQLRNKNPRRVSNHAALLNRHSESIVMRIADEHSIK
jgi:hypothetical protein